MSYMRSKGINQFLQPGVIHHNIVFRFDLVICIKPDYVIISGYLSQIVRFETIYNYKEIVMLRYLVR